MGVAGAVVAGGVMSAGASLVGSSTQASAAQTAAQEQATASANALATEKQQFGVAQTAEQPYINAGNTATSTLTALETPGASQTSTLSQLPGFQFASQWGTTATQNALSAQGLGGSTGPVAKAVSDYNNGLASTYYNNYVSQLQNTASMGANSANALAGNAINSGNSQAATQQSIGTAQASGTLGSANAYSSGLTSAAAGTSNALLLSSLLGNNSSSNGIYAPGTNVYSELTGSLSGLNGMYSGY